MAFQTLTAVRFQQLFELLLQLAQLGRNHVLAVGLKRIIGVELLMVAFGWIEFGERLQGCHNGILEALGLVQFFDERRGFFPLLIIGVENRRAILRTDIVALAIQCRRVMGGEENRHEIAEGDLRRIEFDFNHFGMAGVAHADLLVSGIFVFAAGVARDDGMNAAQLIEHRFGAPETTAAENRDLIIVIAHFVPNASLAPH